ncbi:MAG TPA: SRPBCC family protein [Rhodocyclaceae bacterium]|nr:SRPBCC family protein [Rhodocyclaceae bacterium]
MITIESSMHVPRMRARSVIDFMLTATDERYRAWWPGTHFRMHPLNGVRGVGQRICMDERVGDRHLRLVCEVTELAADRITWQFLHGVKLPGWLTLVIVDDAAGATITHTIRAGFRGTAGRLLDPLLRLWFSARFERMMDEHFSTEFPRLAEMLASPRYSGGRSGKPRPRGR